MSIDYTAIDVAKALASSFDEKHEPATLVDLFGYRVTLLDESGYGFVCWQETSSGWLTVSVRSGPDQWSQVARLDTAYTEPDSAAAVIAAVIDRLAVDLVVQNESSN